MISNGRSGSRFREFIKPAAVVRWTAWAVVCVAILVLTGECTGQVVSLADPNLEQAIREALNKPTSDLTQADLQLLTVLVAQRRGITTLDGFTNRSEERRVGKEC